MTRAPAWAPRPLATDGLALPADLAPALERIAEDVHDRWAAKRLAEGWTWGPERDDRARHHPSLVPYGELSEEEKDYDRATARQTIAALIALGYRIERG